MAEFTTRVELHDANSEDYENLHAAMQKQGFTTTVTSESGKIRKLPTAEYNFEGNVTRKDILDKAKYAAQTVKPNMHDFEILVTKSNGRRWWNLEKEK